MKKLPNCFYGEKQKCVGYSPWNDDEPIEQCKQCAFCESHELEEEET
jgi:hypothetical protein